jgi:hypothetical protein
MSSNYATTTTAAGVGRMVVSTSSVMVGRELRQYAGQGRVRKLPDQGHLA